MTPIILNQKFDSFTSVLIALHWLPVPQCIKFKVLFLVFKAYDKQSPPIFCTCVPTQ
ncbi:hypothetical protein HOLleu_31595 [Holothuria leucospilota]|uniref:Uncharacterized protein n=1 Tax=Holothuria leucospilota TaxID=206669 RepID=A0A9Q1BIF3_HOLLE|nr:hypothetical protein HOLleu_31595 [Holothuria leucospilota]